MIRLLSAAALLTLGLQTLPAAAQDAAAGEKLFTTRCGSCHGLDIAVKKIGPSLAGVVGRPAASQDGFRYSKALAASGLTWSEDKLDEFLTAPAKLVPGTAMPLGVPQASDRAAIIAYLKSKG